MCFPTAVHNRLLSTVLFAAGIAACLVMSGCDSTEPADPIDDPAGPTAMAPAEPTAMAPIESSQPDPPATLTIGDRAPALQLDQWVVGKPVDQALSDGVYVVEFWATWCGPCRVGMPHISELQQHYGDEVTFVGVTREDVETVEEFLAGEATDGRLWRDVIEYRLATDSNDATNTAYMKAANQNGIPTAFIVGRDGMVDWIGHPARIDQPLQQIVDGSWDRDAAIAEYQQQQRLKELSLQLRQWTQNEQWEQALAGIDQLEQELGRTVGVLQNRLMILRRAGRDAEAQPLRGEIVELAWDNSATLNAVAWEIASSDPTSDLDLALKAALRASELRDNQDAAILDTLARVHYELGDLDQAIQTQRLAVEHNAGMAEIDQTLKKYLAEQAESNNTSVSQSESVSQSDTEQAESDPSDSDQSDGDGSQ